MIYMIFFGRIMYNNMCISYVISCIYDMLVGNMKLEKVIENIPGNVFML